MTLVPISFLADRYDDDRIFVQIHLKLFILTSEVIDVDGVRDIYHRIYFDPLFCNKSISSKIHASGEVGKTVSSDTESNHLGIKDWLTSGCEWIQHRCLSDTTCCIAVFHPSRIYGCFFATRSEVCNMIPLIMKSRSHYNKRKYWLQVLLHVTLYEQRKGGRSVHSFCEYVNIHKYLCVFCEYLNTELMWAGIPNMCSKRKSTFSWPTGVDRKHVIW